MNEQKLTSTVQEHKVDSKSDRSVKVIKMATLEPPAFISSTKSYGQYKKDLQMWSRITQVDKKLQAELVVYKLEGHPSGIKEKILTALDGKLAENEKGIDELIKFLDEIYLQDEMADAWEKYKSFEEYSYDDKSLSMAEFISEWHTRKTMVRHQAVTVQIAF